MSDHYHQAVKQGIHYFILPGSHPKQWERAEAIDYPNCYRAVGLHPWFLTDWPEQYAQLEQKITDPSIVALGEIGLDFYPGGSPKPNVNIQLEAFEAQLLLAQQIKLPVILLICFQTTHYWEILDKALTPRSVEF